MRIFIPFLPQNKNAKKRQQYQERHHKAENAPNRINFPKDKNQPLHVLLFVARIFLTRKVTENDSVF